MKPLLVIAVLVLGTFAERPLITLYSEPDLGGYYKSFRSSVEDLSVHNFDNSVSSVIQSGVWIYYENYHFNSVPGRVLYSHGISISMNLPPGCRGITSSIRFAGSPDDVNKNTITFYDSSAFTGGELMTSVDVPNLGYMEGKISSLIVTGPSPWTIYSERNFHGDSLCVASFEHDVGPNGQILDVGIFPTVLDIGIVDNSIKSARSGCHSKSKAKVPSLKADIRMASGASGTLM